MVKLQYTYRGAPITPYRPQRSRGPGKAATVVIVVLLVCGLVYGAWKLYDSMSADDEQNNSPVVAEKQQPASPSVEKPSRSFDELVKENKIATAKNTELSKEMIAFRNEIANLLSSNQLEEARSKLQVYLETYSAEHGYYNSAQKNLAYCSGKLLKSKKANGGRIHKVASGENLTVISRKYHVSIDDIIRASNLKNPDSLRINQELTIPVPVNWSGIINTSKKKLFVYRDQKLLWVFSLNSLPEKKDSFYFDHNNQAFWTTCGLSNSDWTILKSIIPANAKMPVSCK